MAAILNISQATIYVRLFCCCCFCFSMLYVAHTTEKYRGNVELALRHQWYKTPYFSITDIFFVFLYFCILHQCYKTPYFCFMDIFSAFPSFSPYFHILCYEHSIFPYLHFTEYGNMEFYNIDAWSRGRADGSQSEGRPWAKCRWTKCQ